jgi:hypothetical protein
MRRRSRFALSATAAFALLAGTFALGAPAALAGDSANNCTDNESAIEFATAGGFWTFVCAQTGVVGDGGTPHKNDPFDNTGRISLFNQTVPINVPAGDETTVVEGDTTTITYTDVDVDNGGGDLVDIEVVRTFEGSFVRWVVAVTDADDGLPRDDVWLRMDGNLGSDSATQFVELGQSIVSYGDPGDPVLAWQVIGADAGFIGNGADDLGVQFTNAETTILVGMVDYGCLPEDMGDAVTYATSIAPTLSASFGQALVAPGSTFCSTAPSVLYLTPGEPFSVTIPVSYTSAMDFGPYGGSIYDWTPNYWLTDVISDNQDEPGTVPTITIEGVAPASGSSLFSFDTAIFEPESNEYLSVAGNWITLIAGADPNAPVLPATGANVAFAWWIAAGSLLALGLTLSVRAARRV